MIYYKNKNLFKTQFLLSFKRFFFFWEKENTKPLKLTTNQALLNERLVSPTLEKIKVFDFKPLDQRDN